MRIEDAFYITGSGELIGLTEFRKDLVLPLQGRRYEFHENSMQSFRDRYMIFL